LLISSEPQSTYPDLMKNWMKQIYRSCLIKPSSDWDGCNWRKTLQQSISTLPPKGP
jgi:hypothetical protein